MSRRQKLLIGIALAAVFLGFCGALVRGYWGVSQDCHDWVNSHGYQLVADNWWAKTRGCVAKTPAGDQVWHSESLGSKATGWAWQFGIFAAGTLPAVTMIVIAYRRRRL